jgi:hypothetical protein
MVLPYSWFFYGFPNGFHWSGDEQKAASEKLMATKKICSFTDGNPRKRIIRLFDYRAFTRHLMYLSRDDNCDRKFAGLVTV